MSVTAQTFTSTSPAARPISRTMFSLRSVEMPEVFLGQLIQSTPAGARFLPIRGNSFFREAADFVKSMAKSSGVLGSPGSAHLSRDGFSSATTSEGASIRRTWKPSLMPSFFGSGVPEYPDILTSLKGITTKGHEGDASVPDIPRYCAGAYHPRRERTRRFLRSFATISMVR
jgi:hypothetical protein